MKEEEILKYERTIKENEENEELAHNRKRNKIAELDRLSRVASVISSPKGIFRKRCPKCDRVLKRETTWVNACECFRSFKCGCGYEYVTFCDYTDYGPQ